MTYASNINKQNIQTDFLCVLSPRRLVTSWSEHQSNVYVVDFDYGIPSSVLPVSRSATYTRTSSLATVISDSTSGSPVDYYYYDSVNSKIYVSDQDINLTSSSNVVVTYKLHLATVSTYATEDPLTATVSETNQRVHYEPYVVSAPDLISSTTDFLYGFIPSQSGSAVFQNADGFWLKHLNDSTFNKASLVFYHVAGGYTVANTSKIFSGLIDSFTFNDLDISFSVSDPMQIFDESYAHERSASFYTTIGQHYGSTGFPDVSNVAIDPTYVGRPIRVAIGVNEKVFCINLVKEPPATHVNSNKEWALCRYKDTSLERTTNVSSANIGLNTTTRTYTNSPSGFFTGNRIWFDGQSNEVASITDVSYSTPYYIDHTAISAAVSSSSVSVDRYVVAGGSVYLFQDNVEYLLHPIRDYTTSRESTNQVLKIIFTSSIESNLGISQINEDAIVYADAYDSDSTFAWEREDNTLIANHGASIIKGIIRSHFQAELSDTAFNQGDIVFDETNLDSIISTGASSDRIGFMLPFAPTKQMPSYREILSRICQSCFYKVYMNSDGKMELSKVAPEANASKTWTDSDVLQGSYNFSVGYEDLVTRVVVRYNHREVEFGVFDETRANSVSATDTTSARLHNINRTLSINILQKDQTVSQKIANCFLYALSDRQMRLSISGKTDLFSNDINDTVAVVRNKLPGFTYQQGTDRTKHFVVQSYQKRKSGIVIELNDQKGINDHTSEWNHNGS